MRLGPFWWLAPTEYGFHKSQSTQRPSRPPQTRITVRSRATGGRSAYAPCQGSRAAAPAARPVLITSRRSGCGYGRRSVMGGVSSGFCADLLRSRHSAPRQTRREAVSPPVTISKVCVKMAEESARGVSDAADSRRRLPLRADPIPHPGRSGTSGDRRMQLLDLHEEGDLAHYRGTRELRVAARRRRN